MTYRIVIGSLLAIGVAAPAVGQVATPAMREQQVGQELTRVTPMPMPAQAVVESRVTTGRPYAAEATTEFVQTLGDGNKISRKTTVRIYRDGEGRTRREEIGPDGMPRSIAIYDPVAHVSYVLNPQTRVAQKAAMRIMYPATAVAPMPAAVDKIRTELEAGARVAGKVSVVAPTEASGQMASEEMQKRQTEVVARGRGGFGGSAVAVPTMTGANKEPLGTKVIDGVPVDGTRQTVVIPAGSIGNQQPITVTSEQWFSVDLDIFVMTRHSDPRTGETTYTLSNIVRTEPAAGLFDVPADYTIKESGYARQPQVR